MSEKLKVLGLLRVSSDQQDTARQKTDLKRLEAKFNLQYVRVIELHGVSGTSTLDDKQIQQLLNDLSTVDNAGLAISSLDRLFRPGKRYGQFAILDRFVDANAVIFSQREGRINPADDQGYDMCISAGGRAGAEWRQIRQRSMDGKLEKAQQGIAAYGAPPYAYLKIPKPVNKLILDPTESSVPGLSRQDVVRMIYQWRRGGMPVYRIVKELAARGILSAGYKGKGGVWMPPGAWSRPVLIQLLKNRTYRGEAIFLKQPIQCPGIVDPAIWDAVQQVNAESREKNTGRPSGRQYLLQGYLWCARCGHRCTTFPNHGHPYYRCGNISYKPYKQICPAPQVVKAAIERAAFAAVWSILTEPGTLYRLAMAYYQGIERPASGEQAKQEVVHLQERIKRVRRSQWDGSATYEECAIQIKADQARIRELEENLTAMGHIVNMPSEHAAQAAVADYQNEPMPTEYESQRSILEGIWDLRFSYLDGELTAEGKIPVSGAAEASGNQRKCYRDIDRGITFVNSIPFILKRRVA